MKPNIFDKYKKDKIKYRVLKEVDLTDIYKTISDKINEALLIECEDTISKKYECFTIIFYKENLYSIINTNYDDLICQFDLNLKDNFFIIEKISNRKIKKVI